MTEFFAEGTSLLYLFSDSLIFLLNCRFTSGSTHLRDGRDILLDSALVR